MSSSHPKDKRCATCKYWTGGRKYVGPGQGGVQYDAKERARCSNRQNPTRTITGMDCCRVYEPQY